MFFSVDFCEKWSKIEETMELLLTNGAITTKHWREGIADIYLLCSNPESFGDKLYGETKNKLENHVRDLCLKVHSQTYENILFEYCKHWEEYSTGVKKLNGLFSYLNDSYVKDNKFKNEKGVQVIEIGDLGLEIWKKEMILALKEKLVSVLLICIRQDRQNLNTDIPTTAIKAIFSFIDVNMFKHIYYSTMFFKKMFWPDLIRETEEFYSSEASTMLKECNVSQYMESVFNKLKEEKLRISKILPSSFHMEIEEEVNTRMIVDHLSTLLAEVSTIVKKENPKDLGNMYSLLKTIPEGLKCIIESFQEHVKQNGLKTIDNLEEESTPLQFIGSLLQFHLKYTDMIKTLFGNDIKVIGAFDKAFKAVINHKPSSKNICRTPELLSKYCDNLLKKSNKSLNETEVTKKLDQSMNIFKYIDDKDLFQKFYARHLARRLIHQQSYSMDVEEAVIKKMKITCGNSYTTELDQMFTDMVISSEQNSKFQEFTSEEKVDLGINFSIKVLQTAAWPMKQGPLTLFAWPDEIANCVQTFETFYNKRFEGRKLTWLYHLSQGELKVCFTQKTYFMTMSSFQMAILLRFEKIDIFACFELQQLTQLVDEEFYSNLKSLVDSKLLTASSKDINANTVVKLNFDYSNKRIKIKLNMATSRETQKEVTKTHKVVDENRKYFLEAVIVRIMKSRQIINHNDLILEVINQSESWFAPKIPKIKECIEGLIDREYMERSNNENEYSYIA